MIDTKSPGQIFSEYVAEVINKQSKPVEFIPDSMELLEGLRRLTKLPTKLENNFVMWIDYAEPPTNVPFKILINKIVVRDKNIIIKGIMQQKTSVKNKWGTPELTDYAYACEFAVCPVVKLLPTLVAIKDWELKYDLSLSGSFKE